jgi:hypothetical protein
LNGKYSVKNENWFEIENNESGPHTRDPDPAAIFSTGNDKTKNFFTVRVCEKWTSLLAEVKCAKTVSRFKCDYRLRNDLYVPY